MFLLFFGAQAAVVGDCDADPSEPGVLAKAIASFTEGLLFGGSSYAIVQAYAPQRLPTSALSPFPRKTANDLKPGPNGTMVDENNNPYVCLPTGQCIPDLSTMESRKNFASTVAETLGTGEVAMPANCPANSSR
jgi:hypothetical protein